MYAYQTIYTTVFDEIFYILFGVYEEDSRIADRFEERTKTVTYANREGSSIRKRGYSRYSSFRIRFSDSRSVETNDTVRRGVLRW
jgi:hypothetical protein